MEVWKTMRQRYGDSRIDFMFILMLRQPVITQMSKYLSGNANGMIQVFLEYVELS